MNVHVVFVALFLFIISTFGALPKVMLSQQYVEKFGAYCLDGTPNGYYFKKSNAQPNEPGYNSWAFLLEGGGVCVEPVDCEERKSTHLGTSKVWSSHISKDSSILSEGKGNPFHSWNHVFMPYCTGDTHTGTMMNASDIFHFYFSGHNAIKARIQHLRDTANLTLATHILFAGQSAGGIGIFSNADWMKQQFPNAVVKAAPQAGYFFPKGVSLYETWVIGLPVPYPSIAAEYLSEFYHSFLDVSCVAANPTLSGRCWDASFLYPYIETDIFIGENIFDQSLLSFLVWINDGSRLSQEFLAYFGDKMVASMQQVRNSTKPRDGFFMPSCLDHTGNLCVGSLTKVGGYSYIEVLYDWFFEVNKVPHQLVDECWKEGGLPCNKVCSHLCG